MQERNQALEKDLEITQMLKLAEKKLYDKYKCGQEFKGKHEQNGNYTACRHKSRKDKSDLQ